MRVFCTADVLIWWNISNEIYLTLAPLGEGGKGSPCGFSQIAPEVLRISL